MARRRSLLALPLAAAVIATPVHSADAEFPPFAFGDIDFDRQCRPNAAFERVLTVLGGGRPPTRDEPPAFDKPLYDAVSGHASRMLLLDDPVDWNGLRLVSLEVHHGIERGPANYRLVFADPADRVRAVWNACGWNLPPVGESRAIEGFEGYASIRIDAEADGTAAVGCFRD